ncbi:sugar kinase [Streptococcus hillyeri]|uniref:Sugar kinase n=1 Tax=Streptococcus hillyeri TaxID=2282420 RepID=A0A3L9DXY8_9STRE|nr:MULTISPECIES: sugar kinase [Streptococcus]RLY05148.1 sugar kinase [Streptococcus hillyeri]
MKIKAFGEIMLRLSPPQHQTMTQATTFDCQFGGSELNVLSTLGQLGHQVSMISAIPDNDIGHMAESFLFAHQIGQEHLVKSGERLGIYYYQKGFSLRSSRVLYDRKYSSFYESTLSDYDLDAICDDMEWLHVSGITVALNPEIYKISLALMERAKAKGIPISFDLNYRESLWESFEQARVELSKLVSLADVCIGLEPISLLTDKGTDLKDEIGFTRPYRDREALLLVLKEMAKRYELKTIAFTEREIGATNEYVLKAYLYDGEMETLYETDRESIQVLDRVGTGDAYTAGIIYGLIEKVPMQDVLDIAMASFKFKHTIEGDINIVTKKDIEQLMKKGAQDIKR